MGVGEIKPPKRQAEIWFLDMWINSDIILGYFEHTGVFISKFLKL